MFRDNEVFSGFSVDDMDAARRFYGETLGLRTEMNRMGILELMLPTGGHVLVYNKPDHQPASYTMLNIAVRNIEQAVDQLTATGVQMERYGIPEMKQDERGISRDERGPAICWFKDPAGNTLALIEGTAEG